MKKRLFSLVTSFMMILSMLSMNAVNVFAANYSYTVNNSDAPKALTLAKGYYEFTFSYKGEGAASTVLVKGKSAKKAKNAAKKYKYGAKLPTNVTSATFEKTATTSKTLNVSKKAYVSLVLRTQDNAEGTVTVSYKCYPYGGTLQNGTYFEGSGLESEDNVVYYKIKTTGTGYLTIDLVNNESVAYKMTLKNKKKKKNLTGAFYKLGSGDEAKCIPVKAGTYYLAVKCKAKHYKVRYKFTAVKFTGGTKKSKAASITEGTFVKGYIPATGGTRWYKFNNTSTRELVIMTKATAFGGTSDAAISFTVYGGSHKLSPAIYGEAFNDEETHNRYVYYSTSQVNATTAQKATYYVKVTRTKNACGSYEITFREKN